ncbi:MAG: sulfotransferase [Calditrichaeota bacterium]|nr:sulfotransferase [Calditrichota bacterium]
MQSDSSELSCVPFFILSAGRSGSTLLRALINQHPAICLPPESHVLGRVTKKFKSWYRFLPWEYVVRLVISEFQIQYPGFGFWKLDLFNFFPTALRMPERERSLAKLIDLFYMYYAQEKKPEATGWGDKSIGNALFVSRIDELYPNARYILIIRDGRDVAASHVAADTILHTNLEIAAKYWSKSVTAARNFGAKIDNSRFLEISYEDLVQQPEPVVQRLYQFLDLDYTPTALQFWNNVDSLADANREIHKNLRKPINDNSIGKWRQQLNQEEQTFVQNVLKDKLIELNYTVD